VIFEWQSAFDKAGFRGIKRLMPRFQILFARTSIDLMTCPHLGNGDKNEINNR